MLRDDNEGMNNFGALPSPVFPNNLTSGGGTVIPNNYLGAGIGAERLGYSADVAVAPTAPQQVYLAYVETINNQQAVVVQSSSDGGNTFTPEYVTPSSIISGLPSIAVTVDGTVGLLYFADRGTTDEIHFVKWPGGSFDSASMADRVLASFPDNNPSRNGFVYVGDYFQLKAAGYGFFGTFSASGNPLPDDFPSGVYYQRYVSVGGSIPNPGVDEIVGGTVMNNFWLTQPGVLSVDANGDAFPGDGNYPYGIDVFFFWDIQGVSSSTSTASSLQFLPPNILKTIKLPFNPYQVAWPIPPGDQPALELQTTSQLGADAHWTAATNIIIIQTNGMNVALVNPASQQQQFFRLSENISAGRFPVLAASGANGLLSPNGALLANGGQSQTFTATPSNNYAIAGWYLDGVLVQSNQSSLTLSNISVDHTLLATFAPTNDIGVTMAGLPVDIEGGYTVSNDLIYYIKIGNNGLGMATGVTMTNFLPSTVSLVSVTTSQGIATNSGNLVMANIGTLRPGAIALVELDVIPNDTGSITDTVMVACNQFEPNLLNNTATDVGDVVAPVAITTQPNSQAVTNGGAVTFNVGVSGTPPFFFQWYFNNNAITGATNSTLTISNVTAGDNGSYSAHAFQAFSPEDDFEADSQDALLAVISSNAIYAGNNLNDPDIQGGAPDGGFPLVILGEYDPEGPLATASPSTTLPWGTVQDVMFYGQNYDFTLYALAWVSNGFNPNEQTFRVVASANFSGSPAGPGIQVLPVSGFSVNAGDLLAFCGKGPFYPQTANDATHSDATYQDPSNPNSSMATPPGGPGTTFTVGIYTDTSATYGYITDFFGNQGRTYGIGVNLAPP